MTTSPMKFELTGYEAISKLWLRGQLAWGDSEAEKPQCPKITSESVTALKSVSLRSINALR